MSEIIESPATVEEEQTEIGLIRDLAESHGYDPDDVIPLDPEDAAAEAAFTAEPDEPAPPAPQPLPPAIDPEVQFKVRRAKREAARLAAEGQAHVAQQQQQQPTPAPALAATTPEEDIFRDLGSQPDLNKDAEGHVRWMSDKIKQLDATNRALVFDRQQQYAVAQQQQQMSAVQEQQSAWIQDVGRAEQEWTSQNPKYPQKYTEVKEGLGEMYRDQGIADNKVEALVKAEMHGMARLAYDEKVHPCKMIESLHGRMFSNVRSAPARNSSGQFTAARVAKASGEGVDLSGAGAQVSGNLTSAQIRNEGATQRQVQDTLTKIGEKGMLALLEQAERGQ